MSVVDMTPSNSKRRSSFFLYPLYLLITRSYFRDRLSMARPPRARSTIVVGLPRRSLDILDLYFRFRRMSAKAPSTSSVAEAGSGTWDWAKFQPSGFQ